MNLHYSPEVQDAKDAGQAIVALESTVISHGLPYPENLALAQELEAIVREEGAIPATIALIEGRIQVGLGEAELLRLADGQTPVRKLSRRDLGAAIAQGQTGASTVAATMLIAHWAGIRIFATGGIGGVHPGQNDDVSADLIELSQTPVGVVCAGAKSILDLPRTLEWLETFGVPVVGYGSDDFPAFYTRSSGLQVLDRVDSPDAAAAVMQAHWGLGLQNGVLLTVPIPEAAALPAAEIEGIIQQALAKADAAGIMGRELTPFLLSEIVRLTEGRSLEANLVLLRNNARVGAQVAVALLRQQQAMAQQS